MPKIRVGYIVDGQEQSFFTWNAIQLGEKSGIYSIECLIIQSCGHENKIQRIKLFLNFFKLSSIKKFIITSIQKIETFILKKRPEFRKICSEYSLKNLHIKKVYVTPISAIENLECRYSSNDLEVIGSMGLDLLINCSSKILRGSLLDLCPLGILSSDQLGAKIYGRPTHAFWEVYNKRASTDFTFQRFISSQDNGCMAFKGSITTSPIYTLNLARLYTKSSVFLHETIENISNGNEPLKSFKSLDVRPPYKSPAISQLMLYILFIINHQISSVISKIFHKKYRWNVAYQFVDTLNDATLNLCKEIKNPPFRFLADPFIKVLNNRCIAYVEDYDYRLKRGKITAYELFKNGHKELGTAVEEKFHLSYPFLFEHNDNLYMCPETHEANDIRLYKCVDFPLNWKLHKILIRNISAADTNIFKYKDKFWMLTNVDSSELKDHTSELHLFYADDFDSSSWIPHPDNPIIFDPRKARNGGLIFDNGHYYRVYQKQGFNMYGAEMGIARITKIDTAEYQEEVICEIPASFYSNLKGTHTLNYEKGVMIIDYLKYEIYTK